MTAAHPHSHGEVTFTDYELLKKLYFFLVLFTKEKLKFKAKLPRKNGLSFLEAMLYVRPSGIPIISLPLKLNIWI